MATKIVGLDLGTHKVKLCELVTTFRNFELVGFDVEAIQEETRALPSPDAIASAAKRLLERRELVGEPVYCSLPGGLSSTLRLTFPFDQPRKIESVLPFQLEEMLPMDIDEIIYDYVVTAGKDEGSSEVIVAYVRRTEVADLLAALEAQGIDPKRLGVGPLTLFGVSDAILGNGALDGVIEGHASGAKAILDLGHYFCDLVVFENGRPKAARGFWGGGQKVTEALAEVFQVDTIDAERAKLTEGSLVIPETREAQEPPPLPDDTTPMELPRERRVYDACADALSSVLKEVRQTLAAHEASGGLPVDQLYLTGGTSQLTGIAAFLENHIGVPVKVLDPMQVDFNRLSGSDARVAALMAKALGLSIQAHGRGEQSQVNFRRDEFAYTGDFGFLQGRLIVVGLALISMIILGALSAITKKRVLEAEHEQLRQQVMKLSSEVLDVESDDVDLLLATVVSDKGEAGKGIPEVSAFRMIADISESMDTDLKIDVDRLEIDLERKNLQLRGKTGSGGDVERMVDAIRSTKCFKQVKKERVEKTQDDRTRFRLSGASTCG